MYYLPDARWDLWVQVISFLEQLVQLAEWHSVTEFPF